VLLSTSVFHRQCEFCPAATAVGGDGTSLRTHKTVLLIHKQRSLLTAITGKDGEILMAEDVEIIFRRKKPHFEWE